MSRWQTEKYGMYNNRKYRLYILRSRVHLQHHNKCCYLYNLLHMFRWHTEKYCLYNNRKYRLYILRSRVHLQHHNKCCDLQQLCRCLRRRKHLSIHSLYHNNKQGVFRVFGMSCWHKENCNLHCSSKHWMYLLCRGLHIQHHNKCCHL